MIDNGIVPDNCDAGTFLTSVLKCIQTKIGQRGTFRMAINPKYAAGLTGFFTIIHLAIILL
jgi:hypothetical protein